MLVAEGFEKLAKLKECGTVGATRVLSMRVSLPMTIRLVRLVKL